MFNTFKKCCGIVAMFALYLYSAPAAFAQCEGVELSITLDYDSWPEESSWSLTSDGVEVASGDAYTGGALAADGSSETVVACVANEACYTFTMSDSYGDGGTDYTISDADGNVLGSAAGWYGGSTSSEFCLGAVTVAGCTDETACNYNPDASEDDGSCATLSMNVNVSNNYYSAETGFNVYNADTGEIVGSLAAGSYTNSSTIDEEVCVLDNACYFIEVTDTFGDGIGATGTWTVSWEGMSIASGGGSGWSIQTSDTWCFGPGCQDMTASNYNPTATSDSGDCAFFGCTDATACNYDAFATEDDGSCAFQSLIIDITPDNFATEISWNLVDTLGGVVASGLSESAELCLPEDCFTFTMFDSFGDGICCAYGQGSYSVSDQNGTVIAEGGEYGSSESTSFCLPAVPGCTDDMACNYTPGSNIDDGSCDYSCIGCMDTAAANYDPTATQENEGSCIYCEAGTYVAVVEMYDLGGDGWNGANYYMDSFDGSTSVTGNWDEADTYIADAGIDFHCIPLGCYIFTSGGGSADNEIAVIITDQFGTVYGDQVASNYYGPLPPPIGFPSGGWFVDFGLLGDCAFEGCTDPYCFNYNISATVDDGSCICPPPNNAIADAEAIGCDMEVSGSLENASDEEGLTGVFAGTTVTTGGVWYEFNADGDYQVFANTCNTPTATSGFADPVGDTKLHVFTQNDEGGLDPVVGNDDACGLMSGVAFLAETGNNYYIYVSRYSAFTAGTEFLLEVTCEACDDFPSTTTVRMQRLNWMM